MSAAGAKGAWLRWNAALFAEDRRPALSGQVHWQNYGYHGRGERGK
jgi:hypothetical protein